MSRSAASRHATQPSPRPEGEGSGASSGFTLPEGVARYYLGSPSAAGAAQPLEPDIAQQMGAGLGQDLSGVRVRPSSPMQAEAVTRGDEISFAPGRYDPSSDSGRRLLGHELAHVAQQRAGRADSSPGTPGINRDAALESEADAAGDRLAAGESVRLPGGSGSPASVAQGRLGSIGSESWWTKLPSNLNEMMGQASVEDQASAREILEGWLDDEVEAGRRYNGWNDAVQAALKQARQSDEDSGSHEREDSSSEDSDLELCVSDLKAQPIAAEINDLLINIYCGDDEVEEDQGTLERKLWKIHFRARQQNWERTLETIGKTVDGVKPISGWVDDFQPPEMQVEEPKAKYQVEHVEGEPTVGYSGKMNGAVHYRQHQEFPGLLQEIQRNRFELRREYSGRVQDTHVKKIVRDGEVSYQKYISVGDGTFFTDLEHECDHMRQQVRHFENTQEWLVTDLEIDGKEATEAQEKQHKRLQIYHFSALEQEVYMKEFLRLLSRGEVMTGTEALSTIVSREKDHTENIHKWMEHEGGHGPISKWYEETVQPFLGCRGDYLSKKGPFDKT